jgi:hypothetical protein
MRRVSPILTTIPEVSVGALQAGVQGHPEALSFQRRMVKSLLGCDGPVSVPKSWR